MPTLFPGRLPGFSALVFSLITVACGGGGPTAPGPGVADFQGTWEGQWQRTSCSESGGAVGVACNSTPTTGALRLTLTQAGSSVQGNLEVASFIISGSGSVNASGSLTLAGSAHLQSATQTLSNWNTRRSGNSMTGAFTLTITADNPAFGSQVVVLSLQNVTKTS